MQQVGLFDAQAMGAVSAPRTSFWDGAASRHNSELIVDRAVLDRYLQTCAMKAGVTLITDTAVPRPGHVLRSGGRSVYGRMIIDARGRRGCLRGGQRGAATIAIGAAFEADAADTPGSWIVPLDDGWLWAARGGDGGAWVQVTLDAADKMQRPPEARFQAALDLARDRLPPLGAPCSDLLIRDATPTLCEPPADLSVIPIGDALSAMDPLSGHGMFWAVSSALAATAVRRTLEQRDDPETRDLSLCFLRQRFEDVYPRQSRLGRDFIRSQTGRASFPFWARRAGFPDDLPLEDNHLPQGQIVVRQGILARPEIAVSQAAQPQPRGRAGQGADDSAAI